MVPARALALAAALPLAIAGDALAAPAKTITKARSAAPAKTVPLAPAVWCRHPDREETS